MSSPETFSPTNRPNLKSSNSSLALKSPEIKNITANISAQLKALQIPNVALSEQQFKAIGEVFPQAANDNRAPVAMAA